MKPVHFTILLIFLIGCGPKGGSKVDSGFHPGKPASTPTNPLPPTTPTPTPTVPGSVDSGMKISPGTVRAKGSATALRASASPDQRAMKGGQVSGKFSFGRFQPR